MNSIFDLAEKWKADGKTDADIQQLVRIYTEKEGESPPHELMEHYVNIQDGKIFHVEWPWSWMNQLVPCLLPGKLAVLVGGAGGSKSFMMIQCVRHWVDNNISVAILSLELNRVEIMQRVIAQLECNSKHADLKWIAGNPLEANEAITRNSETLSNLGKSFEEADIASSNYMDILDWIKAKAVARTRIIIIDPITAADPGGNQWEQDRMLVTGSWDLAKKHGCTILFVTHPVKNYDKPCLEAIAGGQAWNRHTQLVIWLQAIDPEEKHLKTCVGRTNVECNRVVHLLKATQGRGTRLTLGFEFEKETLTMIEKGVIVKE